MCTETYEVQFYLSTNSAGTEKGDILLNTKKNATIMLIFR